MSSIKTVTLSGAEVKVTGLGGQNTNILNLGSAPIYASSTAHIVPDADGVAEIPAGGGVVLYDTRGTVYLYGTGRAQLTGSDYNTANFKVPSSPGGGGGGGSGGVSQAYVDARDAATLATAKQYTDSKEIALEPATESKLGGVMVGDGLDVETNGKLSAPLATETRIVEIVNDQTATQSDVDELMSLIFDT